MPAPDTARLMMAGDQIRDWNNRIPRGEGDQPTQGDLLGFMDALWDLMDTAQFRSTVNSLFPQRLQESLTAEQKLEAFIRGLERVRRIKFGG